MTYNMPLALHLDHHESLDDIRRKVHAGVLPALMIDGSHFSFAESVRLVKIGCRLLPLPGLRVETELGRLGGVEMTLTFGAEGYILTDPTSLNALSN